MPIILMIIALQRGPCSVAQLSINFALTLQLDSRHVAIHSSPIQWQTMRPSTHPQNTAKSNVKSQKFPNPVTNFEQPAAASLNQYSCDAFSSPLPPTLPAQAKWGHVSQLQTLFPTAFVSPSFPSVWSPFELSVASVRPQNCAGQ